MVRPLRLEFCGAVYHLTARGDRREEIFLGDTDRRRFLDLLGKEVRQQGWRCCLCRMSNHPGVKSLHPDQENGYGCQSA